MADEIHQHQPSVLVHVQEAGRAAQSPCIELRFDGRYDARAGVPYVLLTPAVTAAFENDLRRARLAAVDMEPVDATVYPSEEMRELAAAAGVDADRDYRDVHAALMARVKDLRQLSEPF